MPTVEKNSSDGCTDEAGGDTRQQGLADGRMNKDSAEPQALEFRTEAREAQWRQPCHCRSDPADDDHGNRVAKKRVDQACLTSQICRYQQYAQHGVIRPNTLDDRQGLEPLGLCSEGGGPAQFAPAHSSISRACRALVLAALTRPPARRLCLTLPPLPSLVPCPACDGRARRSRKAASALRRYW